jgi:hypothetical protein
VKYFGRPNFGNPLFQPNVPAPAGRFCCWCGEPIGVGDSGVIMPSTPIVIAEVNVSSGAAEAQPEATPELPYHECCFVRATVGSVGHQRRLCPCFGGQVEDAPGLSIRQAAEAALDETCLQSAHRHARCLRCNHFRWQHSPNDRDICLARVNESECPCYGFERDMT